jgi:hypothetical protein
MEAIDQHIKKHERAIKILEAYKESDRRYNDHLRRFTEHEEMFGWDMSCWHKKQMAVNLNIGLRLARMYENL